jgi:hypothetical protein
VAHFSGQQTLIGQKRDAHALQLHDSLADSLKHAPNLMVTAFDEGNFKPRLFILPQSTDLARLRAAAIQHDTGLELRNSIRVRSAFQLNLITSGNRGRARHQEVRQFSVIGQDHKPGGVKVQPSHRIDALLDSLHQRNHSRAAFRILHG